MSSVRESVEWVFGKIITNFAFRDFKKKLKATAPASRKVLLGWNDLNKLPHMSVWQSDK